MPVSSKTGQHFSKKIAWKKVENSGTPGQRVDEPLTDGSLERPRPYAPCWRTVEAR